MRNTNHNSNKQGIGAKAENLIRLENMGVNVPTWMALPQKIVLQQLPNNLDPKQYKETFQNLKVPIEVLNQLKNTFGKDYKTKTYAVRSSAIDEDGSQFSFAGQFESFLHVPFNQIKQKIKAVWQSAVSDRVLNYRQHNQLPTQLGIGVIIQEMIAADVSGIGFGIDPVTHNSSNKVITAVYGLGAGIVSGELEADTYTITANTIQSNIAHKPECYIKHHTAGIQKIEVQESKKNTPTLSEQQINELNELLTQLNKRFGQPQDIEFSYEKEQLYLLQTRPITSINSKIKEEYILWDNSNIIESYPGITTPLTYSFITKMYEMVYRQFVGIMGVNQKSIDKHAHIFSNTLGLVRGRVYYNLLNWYKMLAMLPGYSINAQNMEKMMGVKESFELGDEFKMNKSAAWLSIIGMVIKMIQMQILLPKKRKAFQKHFNQIMMKYNALDFKALSPDQLIGHYITFENQVLLQWKAPLINDFFAMIWFGTLEKNVTRLVPNQTNLHNDLLCGSQDIISVEPIHKSIHLAAEISKNTITKQFFIDSSPEEIWKKLSDGAFPTIKKLFDDYIKQFGDRCVGELKLETISYAQQPQLFVKIIKTYVTQNITSKHKKNTIEKDIRSNAEQLLFSQLKNKPIKKIWFKYLIKKTRDLVSNRENLRFERTRGFGLVRNLLSELGQQWYQKKYINEARDIFYLELDEIKSVQNQEFNPHFKRSIEDRKIEFSKYKKQTPPQERFFTYGKDFKDEYIYSLEKIENTEEDLKGIGCCPGMVESEVQVVTDPQAIDSLNGTILITTSTDPGWVTLFPTAAGIIVERGSLLSHSAIVSREMEIPCIVGVTGLLRTLKTGDKIQMDGSTGKIKIISNA